MGNSENPHRLPFDDADADNSENPRPPFNDVDADIVFLSSDDVRFHLYKVIVAKVSPVIREMIASPIDPAPTEHPPVVQLTETATTLEHLFWLFYPFERRTRTIDDVDEFLEVLKAAHKYKMAVCLANLSDDMERLIPREPLRIYAVAYTLQDADIARRAAECLLDDPKFHIPPTLPREVEALPVSAMHILHVFRQRCIAAPSAPFDQYKWTGYDFCGEKTSMTLRLFSAAIGYWAWRDKDDKKTRNYIWNAGSTWHHGLDKWYCCPLDTACLEVVGSVKAATWSSSYVSLLTKALDQRPSGNTVRSFLHRDAAGLALGEDALCSSCIVEAIRALLRFDELIARMVDDVIRLVSGALVE